MLAVFGLGGYEMIVVLVVALLIFGRRLPEVMRSMGQGIRQFKEGLHEVEDDVEKAGEAPEGQQRRELPSDEDDVYHPGPG